ncbi:hypothetical protein R1sor_020955 [Riccia sorocarpa]|uniref:Integrase catalytic domain-containing protein n=1 Tax=Riccia sorocarpa TaxID=122646 RepID=A0ABD3GHS5_9MARC
MVEAEATRKDDVVTVAEFFFRNVIARYGCPLELVSDGGTHFLNQLMTELTNHFQIKHRKTTPYNPKANGLTEKANGLLCRILNKVTVNHAYDWDTKLPAALWAYRSAEKLIKLEEDRKKSKDVVEAIQQKRKENYDKRIRKVDVKEEDLVLLYDNRHIKFPRKLHLRWMGPYKTLQVFDNGSLRITDLEDNEFATRVNGWRVKRYYT